MDINKNNSSQFPFETTIPDDQIDLRSFISVFFRNKTVILLVSFLSIFISQIYIYSVKKVWEGEFQIVVDSNRNRASSNNLSTILSTSGFVGNLKSSDNNLNTQVGILKSPSVLMPILNYVNNERKKNNTNASDLVFDGWLNSSLKVKLEDGTSILNISYKDKNKKLVIPVLTKISDTYQIYSGRNKKRGFELAKEYLNKQIFFYKDKSKRSIRIAQEYAIDQDLALVGISNGISNTSSNIDIQKILSKNSQSKFSPNLKTETLIKNIDIENVRVNAANKIRNINIQIDKIINLDDEADLLLYLNTILQDFDIGFSQKLNQLNLDLVQLKAKYTDKTKQVRQLEDLRKIFIKEQKISIINYLKAQRIAAESTMESAMRPKGVIIRYKELIREADRDENIVIALEDELRNIKLEEARLDDPWELITKPTIKKFPVKPIPNRIRFVGFSIGLLISYLFFYIKEKISGKIFDNHVLENILGTNILAKINLYENENLSDEKQIIRQFLYINRNKKISFMATNSVKKETISQFKKIFEIEEKINFERNLFKLDNEIYILIASFSDINYQEIINLKKRAEIAKSNIYGVILI